MISVRIEYRSTLSDEALAARRKGALESELAIHRARGETLSEQEQKDALAQFVKEQVDRVELARDGAKWSVRHTKLQPPLVLHRAGYDVVTGVEEEAACDGVEARLVIHPNKIARVAPAPGDRLRAVFYGPQVIEVLAGTQQLPLAAESGTVWRVAGQERVNGYDCIILEGTATFGEGFGNVWRYWLAPDYGYLPVKTSFVSRRPGKPTRASIGEAAKLRKLAPGLWIAMVWKGESRVVEPTLGPIESWGVREIVKMHSFGKPLPMNTFELAIPPETLVEDLIRGTNNAIH